MKVQPRKVERKEKIRYLNAMYGAIATLSSSEEIRTFLNDLLTESERIMMGRRILIAQRLLEEQSYDSIAGELHVGLDTIAKVHKCMEDDERGYEVIFEKLNKKKLA